MRTKKTPKTRYLEKTFSHEDPVLQALRREASANKVEYMQISAYEGRILQFLCHALKTKTVVELGTLYAYSTLMIARALPPGGRVFTLDTHRQRQQRACEIIQGDPAAKKIQFIPGRALDSLKALSSRGPFDMVFIDADKAAYMDYLSWSSRHLKPGGLLVADNTFLFGAVYGQPSEGEKPDVRALKIMQQFNQEVAREGGAYISTLIPTAEGLTVGIKKC